MEKTMNKKLIAAGIGIVALTATGCAVPGATEIVTERERELVNEVAPTQPAYSTAEDKYEAYVASKGVPTSGGIALGVGHETCRQYDSVGYETTMNNMLSANTRSGAGLSTSHMSAMMIGAAAHLCPEHRQPLSDWLDS